MTSKILLCVAMMCISLPSFAVQRCTFQRGKIIEVSDHMKEYTHGTIVDDMKLKTYHFNFVDKYLEIKENNRSLTLPLECVIIKKANKN